MTVCIREGAGAALRRSACELALANIESEFPAFARDPRLQQVVAVAISSLARFGQSDRHKLAVYAAARGRTFIAEQSKRPGLKKKVRIRPRAWGLPRESTAH